MSTAAREVLSRSESTRRAPRAGPDPARPHSGVRLPFESGAPELRRCACGGGCPGCRATTGAASALPIDTPGDPFEREADAAADAVMRGGVTGTVSGGVPAISRLQRCACGGGCPRCGAKKEEELRREDAGAGGAPGYAPSIVHDVLASPGRPLDGGARSFMEQRFGAGFGGVRVHDDARAAESARAVDAHAYTVGSHVVFGAARYAPGTPGGDRLLAHELAHVVQQGEARAPRQVARYRKESSPNFGACDGGGLEESSFTRGKDPYVKKITIEFNAFTKFADGDVAPTGTLSAEYVRQGKIPDIQGVPVTGGYGEEGFSQEGTFTVPRIEGCGYDRDAVPGADRLQHKESTHYYKKGKTQKGNMSFAIFFFPESAGKSNQAIHRGSLTDGSMACVHMGTLATIRQLNYHSVAGVTKVQIKYSDKIRKDICCVRHKYLEKMPLPNPCSSVKKCP